MTFAPAAIAENAAAPRRGAGPAARRRRTLRIALACLAGSAIGLNSLGDGAITLSRTLLHAAGGIALLAAILAAADRLTRIAARELPAGTRERYYNLDALATLPWLATFAGALGLRFYAPEILGLILMVLAAKALAWALGAGTAHRRALVHSRPWLAVLFFFSGFAALIYQIVWERALYATFGVNIQSITIIVSIFMFGLGLGALLGGAVVDRHPQRAAALFLACEVGTGIFGCASLALIHFVSAATLRDSMWIISLTVFALLCLPTLLMGATLPILVSHLYRSYLNLGQAVGILYSVNTLGSALACFVTADLLFVFLGQHGAVFVAAACNLLVGWLVFRYIRSTPPATLANPEPPSPPPGGFARRRLALVLGFATAAGFISLSQELLWMRLAGYQNGSLATVFPHVLGCFLIGVAAGAAAGERLCARRFAAAPRSMVPFIGVLLLLSAAFYHTSIGVLAWVSTRLPGFADLAFAVAIAMAAALLGGLFTLLCHYGKLEAAAIGTTISRVYLANILGATLGPILTGFVLLDHMGIASLILALSLATALLGLLALAWDAPDRRLGSMAAALAVLAALALSHRPLYASLLNKLQFKADYASQPYTALIQNRTGIIAVTRGGDGGSDRMYGNAAYDGRFMTDPVALDRDIISRAYFIAALHPHPARILEIGLSTASFARVFANYRPVQHLTSVEINPGYLDLLRNHPTRYAPERSLLDDPKTTIVIDDGRRWLNRHPDARFDLIVSNTTYHWRAETTHLLSREFFELCKSHLNPNGVLYYNTTRSDDAAYTSARVFQHEVRYLTMAAASDHPFDLRPEQIAANLDLFSHGGHPTFTAADPARAQALSQEIDRLAHTPLLDVAPALRQRRDLYLITDDNMAPEFKRVPVFANTGPALSAWHFDSQFAWLNEFRRRNQPTLPSP